MNSDEILQSAEEVSNILRILGNRIRLLAVCSIGAGEISVQDLADRLGTTQSNLSQHLSKLKLLKVLECRRDGNTMYYRIRDKRIIKLIEHLQMNFCGNRNIRDLE